MRCAAWGGTTRSNNSRVPPMNTPRMIAPITPRRTSRLALMCNTPSRLAATSIDSAAVCIVATSEPKREFRTPDIVNRSNKSAGNRNRSSRNGIAALMLPNMLSEPAVARLSHWPSDRSTFENHAPNGTNASDRILPVCGKLNSNGTTTPMVRSASSPDRPCSTSSCLLASAIIGSTTK
jgi:hypothetical protein